MGIGLSQSTTRCIEEREQRLLGEIKRIAEESGTGKGGLHRLRKKCFLARGRVSLLDRVRCD